MRDLNKWEAYLVLATNKGTLRIWSALVDIMTQKFERVLEPTDTWAIFEVESGEPAMLGDRMMIGLSESEAEQFLAQLNTENKRGKRSAA